MAFASMTTSVRIVGDAHWSLEPSYDAFEEVLRKREGFDAPGLEHPHVGKKGYPPHACMTTGWITGLSQGKNPARSHDCLRAESSLSEWHSERGLPTHEHRASP